MMRSPIETIAWRWAALVAALPLLALAGARVARSAEPYRELGVDEVERMLGAKDVVVLDVNPPDLFARSHVPGAIHVGKQKLETLLPSDRTARLVFYCANTLWTSSHQAARAAARKGYQNVFVMPAGIQGWVKAGKPVEKGST